MKKKLINLEPKYYSEKAKKILKKKFNYSEFSGTTQNKKILINKIKDYDIIITRFKFKLDRKILSECNKLKSVISATTGLDHLDVPYLKEKKIKIYSLKNKKNFLKKIKSSSEHTWALLLSIIKKIPQSFDSVKKLKWDRYLFLNNILYKKKIGIIGLGRNGKNIVKYSKAFGMKIITYDKGSNFEKLKIIFKTCDMVILTIELNESTKNLVNSQLLNLVNKNFILVNTSRAEVINQNDLINKIKESKLFYFASDFLEFKDGVLTSSSKKLVKLSKSNQILITPHLAGASLESWNICEEYLAKLITKYEK